MAESTDRGSSLQREDGIKSSTTSHYLLALAHPADAFAGLVDAFGTVERDSCGQRWVQHNERISANECACL